MKGLLLKDWYMMKKHYRAYLLIAAAFLGVSMVNPGNLFFIFYPCLLCGMIPVNLLAYDEHSRWIQYCDTLPCTRAQFVSAKYLTGLLAQLSMLADTGLAQGIKMAVTGGFSAGDFTVMMLLMFIVATVTPSISLPFVFKLGTEKGRTAYYVMISFVCGASAIASGILGERLQTPIRANLPLIFIAIGGIGIYILSWHMSIRFYQQREL